MPYKQGVKIQMLFSLLIKFIVNSNLSMLAYVCTPNCYTPCSMIQFYLLFFANCIVIFIYKENIHRKF